MIFTALAFFVVAASALQSGNDKRTTELVCPTERPCCSCKCIPKECGPVPYGKQCQFVHCLIKCPHVCENLDDNTPTPRHVEHHRTTPEIVNLLEESDLHRTTPEVAANVTCPTTRPCCSCACPPKGCPKIDTPDHCKRIRCLIKCPHTCDHEEVEEHRKTTQDQQVTCPSVRPCCTCACPPKGCPEWKRPDSCKHIKCLRVCPHKCEY